MGVPDEHVAGVRHVDAVGEVGDVLAPDAAQEPALVVEHDYAVPFEIAHVELFTWNIFQYLLKIKGINYYFIIVYIAV